MNNKDFEQCIKTLKMLCEGTHNSFTIAPKMGISQATVKRHIKFLRDQGCKIKWIQTKDDQHYIVTDTGIFDLQKTKRNQQTSEERKMED